MTTASSPSGSSSRSSQLRSDRLPLMVRWVGVSAATPAVLSPDSSSLIGIRDSSHKNLIIGPSLPPPSRTPRRDRGRSWNSLGQGNRRQLFFEHVRGDLTNQLALWVDQDRGGEGLDFERLDRRSMFSLRGVE